VVFIHKNVYFGSSAWYCLPKLKKNQYLFLTNIKINMHVELSTPSQRSIIGGRKPQPGGATRKNPNKTYPMIFGAHE